jgi:hypothetical protein
LSAAIAVKSRVNEFAEIDGTAALLEPELVEVGVPLLPHAAMTRAALPATAVSPAFLVTEDNKTTSLVGRDVTLHAPGRVSDDDHRGGGAYWPNTKTPPVNDSINIGGTLLKNCKYLPACRDRHSGAIR